MRSSFKVCITFFSILILLSCVGFFALAQENNFSVPQAELFTNPNERVLSVSRKGAWHSFPENSLEAVLEALEIGVDIVKIDLQKTKDGVLILMEDETVGRTLYNSDNRPVNELLLSEIKEYYLLSAQGETLSHKTEYRVPTLEEVLDAVKGKGMLLLDNSWQWRDEIYSLVAEKDMLNSVIFMARTSAKEIGNWLREFEENPLTIGYYKGNIIFMSLGYINSAINNGAYGVQLATKNPYGINFYKNVLKNFNDKGRAVIDMTDPSLSGTIRGDTEKWWNDVISRGYNVIITDYPAELVDYINRSEIAREKLENLVAELNGDWILPEFMAYSFADYRRAYNRALSTSTELLSDKSASEQDLSDAFYALQNSVDNIKLNYTSLENGISGMTISAVRVITAVLAITAVVSAQVYTYKKRKNKV